MPDVIFTNLKNAREAFLKMFGGYSLLREETPEKQEVWDEMEKLLKFVLDNYSEDIHAVMWVVVSSKKDTELETRAIHSLYTLNKEKPFPGL